MARPLLLDVDTGVDDAVAIALATRLEQHELLAITTVAGNVPVELATENTRRVVAWLGEDVPVYRGMSQPLVRPLQTAREHHGYDGLGGWKIPVEPVELQPETATEAIIRLARRRQGEITFVFTGPLTNLAVALSLEPRIVDWVDRLIIMGGAFFKRGNTTEYAEFNVYADPEAAARIAQSGFNTTWVPLDATHHAVLTRDQWDELTDADDVAAVLVREVMRRNLLELDQASSYLHDPLAVAVAEDSDVVAIERGAVVVDTSERRRGQTRLAEASDIDVQAAVARHVNQDRFTRLLNRLLAA